MSTPTVTENPLKLEPVTRDDFADPPASAATADRGPAHRFVPTLSRER